MGFPSVKYHALIPALLYHTCQSLSSIFPLQRKINFLFFVGFDDSTDQSASIMRLQRMWSTIQYTGQASSMAATSMAPQKKKAISSVPPL